MLQRRTVLSALALPLLGSRALAQGAPAWPQRAPIRFIA